MNNQQGQEVAITFEQRHPEEDDALYSAGVAVLGIGSFATLANVAVVADEYFELDYYMLDQLRGTELSMISIGLSVAVAGASMMKFASERVRARLRNRQTALILQDILLDSVFSDVEQLSRQSITSGESA